MFGTFVHDQFKKNEFLKIADSIIDSCSPDDSWGWASTGIYFFRSVPKHEILYIGLANDLYRRFSEHTGLVDCSPASCKINQIEEYFSEHEYLGITLLLQSKMDQMLVGKKTSEIAVESVDSGVRASLTEGYFIKAYEKIHGIKPAWNKVHGSKKGHSLAEKTNRHSSLLKYVDPSYKSIFTSRKSISELAEDSYSCELEFEAHVVRMMLMSAGASLEEGKTFYKLIMPEKYKELESLGYFLPLF